MKLVGLISSCCLHNPHKRKGGQKIYTENILSLMDVIPKIHLVSKIFWYFPKFWHQKLLATKIFWLLFTLKSRILKERKQCKRLHLLYVVSWKIFQHSPTPVSQVKIIWSTRWQTRLPTIATTTLRLNLATRFPRAVCSDSTFCCFHKLHHCFSITAHQSNLPILFITVTLLSTWRNNNVQWQSVYKAEASCHCLLIQTFRATISNVLFTTNKLAGKTIDLLDLSLGYGRTAKLVTPTLNRVQRAEISGEGY